MPASGPLGHPRFLERHRPSALAVSCNLPLFFSGVTRLVDAAHVAGVPALAGGRALQSGPQHAHVLGADGWAPDADGSIVLLRSWQHEPPSSSTAPTRSSVAALELDLRARELASAAFDDLAERLPAMAGYDARQLTRALEDLAYIVQFVAAAQLVDDPSVLREFLAWLVELLGARGVPKNAVVAGLGSLSPLLDQGTCLPHCGRACRGSQYLMVLLGEQWAISRTGREVLGRAHGNGRRGTRWRRHRAGQRCEGRSL